MRNKYWAKEKYADVDPADYTLERFSATAGKLIDEVEKKMVLDLLLTSGIDRNKEIKILDVATGTGRLAFYLEEHSKNTNITAIDINNNMLKTAKITALDKKSKIHIINGDIYNLPFRNNQFDVVVGLRFSMHLPEINIIINKFSKIIKKNGILIFDIFNSNSILQLKSHNKHNPDTASGWYSITQITNISKKCGLKLVRKKGIFLLGETILRKFPDKLRFMLYPTVRPLFLGSFSTKVILCFQKL